MLRISRACLALLLLAVGAYTFEPPELRIEQLVQSNLHPILSVH